MIHNPYKHGTQHNVTTVTTMPCKLCQLSANKMRVRSNEDIHNIVFKEFTQKIKKAINSWHEKWRKMGTSATLLNLPMVYTVITLSLSAKGRGRSARKEAPHATLWKNELHIYLMIGCQCMLNIKIWACQSDASLTKICHHERSMKKCLKIYYSEHIYG
jgi:hypothetical protein